MKTWNRRDFLALSAATGAASALPLKLHAAVNPVEDFTFLFITDCHLQPELNAAGGCHQAFAKARKISSDFVIQGGDHVFDALGVSRDRATILIDLYTKTEQDLGMKVHHTIGNHDLLRGLPSQRRVAHRSPLRQEVLRRPLRQALLLVRPQRRSLHRARFDRHHRRPQL